MRLVVLIILSFLLTSCNSYDKKVNSTNVNDSVKEKPKSQIGEYVTSAFEDSKGHLWFGTLSKGIAKYDGKKLKYFTIKDGLLKRMKHH